MRLGFLLAVCLAHGLWVTHGLVAPPDLDGLRDIGFAQAMLDGDWFGDPAYTGAIRYYPPLVPALMAGLAWMLGADDLPRLWVVAGPFLGLLPVAMFFAMARAMFGARAGWRATLVFVLWNAASTAPWVGGGYSPWLLTPLLAQAGFLAAAWLIHARAAGGRWRDAGLIGAAIGTVFLAHVVPAIVLTAMLIGAAIVGQGRRWRVAGWLGVAGIVQIACMAPYMLPLLVAYPDGVVHLAPGAWVAGELRAGGWAFALIAAINAPWLGAALLLAGRASWPRRVAGAMLSVWLALCLLVLCRHFACIGLEMRACRFFRLPVHHFHLYLQIGGACALGLALARVRLGRPLAVGLIAAGLAGLWLRPYDGAARAAVPVIDLAAYRWIRAHTPADAVFVTFLPTGAAADFDPAAFAVMAGGRKLVAFHALFSNPYLPWAPREALRAALMEWRAGGAAPATAAIGASPGWAIVPRDAAPSSRARLMFVTADHRIEMLAPLAAPARDPGPAGCAMASPCLASRSEE